MGKRTRLRTTKKKKTQNEKFRFFCHPLADVDPEIIKSALVSLASKSENDFSSLLNDILNLLRQKFPPHILAVLSGHGSFAGVTSDGVGERGMIERLEQHHIELLQALILKSDPSEWGQELATPTDLQLIIDKINDLADAFHQRRFASLEKERDPQQGAALGLQERIRLHTQAVRNWGYFSHVVQISFELYSPLDSQYGTAFGFTASNLIQVARCLVSLLEQRVSEKFRLLKIVFKEKQIKRFVRKYYEVYPFVKGDPEEYIKNIPESATLNMVKSRILAHSDIAFLNAFSFTPDEVASECDFDRDVVFKIFNVLSIRPGALKETNPEHIFMDNPVWSSPFVEINGEFFCPLPQIIFSHIHHIMRSLCEAAETANLKKSIEDRRAAYLENKVDFLLRKTLPSAKIVNGAKWRVGSVQYETDHIVKIDKTVIIFEDKSGTLSGPGLRGAQDRVKNHIHELIVKPSQQSARLESLIWKARSGDAEALSILSTVDLNFDGISRIIRVSITLDDFSILSSAEGALKEAGWIPADIQLATTLSIADFQCITEILEKPSFFVHYLTERQRFQKAVNVMADELDWLGFYLETGFNIWGIEDKKRTLELTGMSRVVDRYYASLGAGLKVQKPLPKIHPLFWSLINGIEGRAFLGWLDVSLDLLRCADYTEQGKIDKMLTQLKSKVRKNWCNPQHECSAMVTPPPIRDTAIVFHAYPEKLADRRKEVAYQLGSKAFELSGRARCIVIGMCIDQWNKPHSFIYIFNADMSDRIGN
jgi:hypothetical protein